MLFHGLLYIPGLAFLEMPFFFPVKFLVVLEFNLHFHSKGLGKYSAEFLGRPQIQLLCSHVPQ